MNKISEKLTWQTKTEEKYSNERNFKAILKKKKNLKLGSILARYFQIQS